MAEGQDDELRDLSPEDAQELQAFVEKRRWFEGKLKSLEEIPAIYPFLHPSFDPSSNDDSKNFIRSGASSSKWQLPDQAQVKRWKREREVIEEQVLEFDGGDLGRMKKKTRAATLLPLTPPSTHLVSITLDLIVVIDRLLALLRRRGQLLELTELRLQWDQVRWQVVLEARGLREEVDAMVRDKGRWTPVDEVTPEYPIAPSSHPQTPMSRDPGSATLTSLSSSGSLVHLSTSPQSTPLSIHPKKSPSPSRHPTPNRSLHMPLLHSQLVNLRIRHKNLVSTQLARTGKLLDRMIDVAAGLKALGDTEGPVEVSQESDKEGENGGGAVPEKLLDVQDELDAEVEDLGGRVAWCGELEEHWKLSEAHHTSSTQTRHLATSLIEELQQSLSQPATSNEHLRLSNLLTKAQRRLPRPISPSFPRPSHPSYPENDAYNLRVVEALRAAHGSAEVELAKGREGVEWYARLAQARETLICRQAGLAVLDKELRGAVDLLGNGSDGRTRPDPADPVVLLQPHVEEWSNAVPARTGDVSQVVERCTTACQHAALAVLQYRNLAKTPPRSLRSALPERLPLDSLVEDVEKATDSLLEQNRVALGASKTAQEDSEILLASRGIVLAAQGIGADTTSVRDLLEHVIRASAWPGQDLPTVSGKDDGVSVAAMDDRIKQLDRRIKNDVGKPLAALHDVLKTYERRLPALRSHLSTSATELIDQQTKLRELLDLLVRVRRQAEVVNEVHGEAERMLRKVKVLQDEVDRVGGEREDDGSGRDEKERTVGTILARVGTLETDTAEWEGKLAERVPFLAREAGPSVPVDRKAHTTVVGVEASEGKPARLPPTTSSSVPPMTPPLSRSNTPQQPALALPTLTSSSPLDISALDASVRSTINDLTLRVASSLSHSRSSCQSTLLDIYSARCHAVATSIDKAFTAWQATHEKARSQTDNLLIKVGTPPTSVNAAKATVQAIEALISQFAPKLENHPSAMAGAVGHLREAVERQPTWVEPGVEKVEMWQVALKTASGVVDEALEEIEAVRLAGEDALARAKRRLAKAQLASKSSASLPLAPVAAQDDVFGGPKSPVTSSLAPSTPPRTSPALPDDLLERVQRVRQELDTLQLERIVDPRSAELHATPALHRLPFEELASGIEATLAEITAQVQTFAIPLDHPARPELTDLQHALDVYTGALPRLGQLVAFNASAKACDGTFSRLLEIIDDHQLSQDALLLAVRDEANMAFERVLSSAKPVEKDRRVSSEVKRLTGARGELQTLVEECLHPETKVGVDDSASEMTRAESVISMASMASTARPFCSASTASRLPRLSGLSGSLPRSTSRSASNPQGTPSRLSGLPLAAFAHTQSSRNRAVSDTPTRSRLDSVREGAGVGLPRPRASLGLSPALGPISGTPSRGAQAPSSETRVRKSSIPRAVRASTPSSQAAASPSVVGSGVKSLSSSQSMMSPRLRRSSRLPSLPPMARREYVADPKNKLDVAVGKIVNNLSFDVPVRPVGPSIAKPVAEWKDLSGQYWIGSEGKAKLCFCRILRSRTVMVRVGGGWVQLSKFLLDHFAEMMAPLQPPLSPRSSLTRSHSSSTSLFNTSFPIPLTSASVASQTGLPPLPPLPTSHSNTSVASSLGHSAGLKTPSRPSLSLPRTPDGHLSAERPVGRQPTLSPHTPGSGTGNLSFSSTSPSSAAAGASPGGSPLVAFQFMRKAAESPKVREKEKERYVEKFVGRRSTLGREREREKSVGL
ncbi:hypothetical protein IAT38_004232 [Cryptococcus sp. DSM 104549]